MREGLTVSGIAALTTTTSAPGDRRRARRSAPSRSRPAATHLLEVHLVRDRHPGAAVDQRDVVGLVAQQQVEGERRADAAAPADDGDTRWSYSGARLIVRRFPWVDSTDKVAFITGAAGSIGAATARRFVAEGARVVLRTSTTTALTRGRGRARRRRPRRADVTDSAAVRAAVRSRSTASAASTSRSPTPASSATSRRSPTTTRTSSTTCSRSTSAARSSSPSTRSRAMRDGGSLILNSSVVGLTVRPRHRRLRDVQARARRAHAHRRQGGRRPRHPRQHDPPGPGRQRVPAPRSRSPRRAGRGAAPRRSSRR